MDKYKIIDNFLSIDDFKNIKSFVFSHDFSWYICPQVSDINEKSSSITSSYYFVNLFWSAFDVKPSSRIFEPILTKLDVKSVIRIKANLYPSTEKIIYHESHCDYNFDHKGAIFYLNTNDGFTILEDGTKIESIENRILLFDPSKPHNSTTCTNDKCRVNVNFNYF